MNEQSAYDSLLDDSALAPLKRNQACLRCKKKKVKCDSVHPNCSPCLRSYARALRTAQRNKTSVPVLTCIWADVDTNTPSDEEQMVDPALSTFRPQDKVKITGEGRKSNHVISGVKRPAHGKELERERGIRRDEEVDTLRARIAELELRLSGLTPSDSSSSNYHLPRFDITPQSSDNPNFKSYSGTTDSLPWQSTVEAAPLNDTEMLFENTYNTLPDPVADDNFDVEGFFVVPANWPKNLPCPFILEHLVETFFTHAPQLTRMIHRPTLLTRLKSPATSTNFPQAALLHAICAYAAPFTAWVTSLPPHALEAAIAKEMEDHLTIEGIDDFGLAQAEAAQRCLRGSTQCCHFENEGYLLELIQASIIISDLYFSKGLPLTGWLQAGIAPRLIKALQLQNKPQSTNPSRKMGKNKRMINTRLVHEVVEREERLATLWLAFNMDAGFSANSFWSQSSELGEIRCALPAGGDLWGGQADWIPENPQDAHSVDLLTHHPVADSFVLVCKASILMSKASKWARDWNQRNIRPGDELEGTKTPGFKAIANEIRTFQISSLPAVRTILRQSGISTQTLDANLLLVHILPDASLILHHEPFVDWTNPSDLSVIQIKKSCEAVVGVLHLIPSNLDVALITTTTLTFSLYSVGRLLVELVAKSLEVQEFAMAVKYRADLQTIQDFLLRCGQKHSLGVHMSTGLDMLLQGEEVTCTSQLEWNKIRAHRREEQTDMPEGLRSGGGITLNEVSPSPYVGGNNGDSLSMSNRAQKEFEQWNLPLTNQSNIGPLDPSPQTTSSYSSTNPSPPIFTDDTAPSGYLLYFGKSMKGPIDQSSLPSTGYGAKVDPRGVGPEVFDWSGPPAPGLREEEGGYTYEQRVDMSLVKGGVWRGARQEDERLDQSGGSGVKKKKVVTSKLIAVEWGFRVEGYEVGMADPN